MSNYVANATRLVGAHLTTTGNTTVFTATGYTQVVGIRLANVTGTDRTASVAWHSSVDATDYLLLFQHIVPANSAVWLPLEAFALKASDEIRVQASLANAIDVIVSVAEVPGRSG